MKLKILGSGTMMPTKERHPSGYLLEHEGNRILLDCGHTTVARLIELGIDLHSIDTLAITHFHTDHFGDVLPFVHSRFVDDLITRQQHKTLSVIGPPTTQERFQKMREVMWPEPAESYPITFHEFQPNQQLLAAGPFSVQQFSTNHVSWFPSTGYRITVDNQSFAYPGDVGSEQDSAFEESIRNVNVLLIEAGAEKLAATHLTAEQAIALAQRCGISRLLLTHVHEKRVNKVQEMLKNHNNVLLAADGMEIGI
jgi:ribonuclease BN (tRNA processing enzyme)